MSTKNIHVVALGNALVDLEYIVSDNELAASGLSKGGMTLASSDDQQLLLKKLSHLEARQSSGGSAANTVIAFGQFGGRAAYKSLLGNDAYGHFYASEFSELGLELFAEKSSEQPTGTCIVLVSPDAERTMQTSLGVNTNFSAEHVDERVIARSEWLYIEGYKFTEESGAAAIDEAVFYAKKHDTKIAVTFSDTFIVNVFRNVLNKAATEADLIFCNEFEAKAYAETDSIDEAYSALAKNMPNVALTLGSDGSRIKVGTTEVRVPAVPTSVLNTNGAGDMFAGAFLYGITHGLDPRKSGELASLAAARVVAQHGARLQSSHTELRDAVLGRG